jgi:ATP-binding cassette subfamily B multidrug efflux pump
MNSIRMIFFYWWKSKKEFILTLLLQTASAIFTLIIPIFLGLLVGNLAPDYITSIKPMDLIVDFAIIVILSFLAFLTGRKGRINAAIVSNGALYYLRADIHNAIYRQSFKYFDEHETGELVARSTSDVEQTELIFAFGIMVGLQSILQLTGILISVLLLDIRLSWIFMLSIPTSLAISFLIMLKLKPIFLQTRQSFGRLTNSIRENIVGAQVVRLFSTQKKEKLKFDKDNKNFYKASVESVKFSSLFQPINLILISFMILLLLFIGGQYVILGIMQIPALITLISYAGLAVFPLIIFGQIFLMYIQADAALKRVSEILEANPEIKEAEKPLPIKDIKGKVEFSNVFFGYRSKEPILQDVSFSIEPGEKLAILGATGSGKSTIINLLPRFYDVNEGVIKVDGIDLRKYNINDLRSKIGVVSQDTFLFNKSISDNIKFGKDNASMEEVIEAAKNANLYDFIMTLPDKFDTIIGERGTRLSGGQKQRLSIARALLIRPKILVLDDSTSSVDVETEYEIQQALKKLTKNITTIIITQRLSSIRNADKIMILDKGRVIGLATHEELLKDNIIYRQMYETILSEKDQKSTKTEGS